MPDSSSRSKPVFRLPVELIFLLLLMLPLMMLLGAAARLDLAPVPLFWLLWVLPLIGVAWLLTCCEPEETATGHRAAARQVRVAAPSEPFAQAINGIIKPARGDLDHGVYVVEGVPQVPRPLLFRELERRLAPYGVIPLVEDTGTGTVRVIVLPKGIDDRVRTRPSIVTNVLLLAATVVTTTYVGAQQQGIDLLTRPSLFTVGLPYSLTLLGILGIHELGHYVMGRYHGVEVTLPYFIPVPFGLGTFGAFIQIKSLIKSRRAVFDIGIAGPLAGLLVAIPLLYLGLRDSTPLPALQPGGGWHSQSSLLLTLMYQLVHGRDAAAAAVQLSPIALAAWIGIFVTALNLLPVGQLDGGHIAYALVGSRYARTVGVATVVLMMLVGIFFWPGLLTWALIVALIAGFSHMPALDDITPPDAKRVLLGLATLLLPLFVLLPAPSAFGRSTTVRARTADVGRVASAPARAHTP